MRSPLARQAPASSAFARFLREARRRSAAFERRTSCNNADDGDSRSRAVRLDGRRLLALTWTNLIHAEAAATPIARSSSWSHALESIFAWSLHLGRNGLSAYCRPRKAHRDARRATIFETHRPWETTPRPSRAMRLLIGDRRGRAASPTVASAARSLPPDRGVHGQLRKDSTISSHARALKPRTFTTRGGDGSPFSRTSSDVVARARSSGEGPAYNPNDCVEIRWGGPPRDRRGGHLPRAAPRDHERNERVPSPGFRTKRPARATPP